MANLPQQIYVRLEDDEYGEDAAFLSANVDPKRLIGYSNTHPVRLGLYQLVEVVDASLDVQLISASVEA